MKKLFTIIIVLLTINICAQNITFGAKAGLNSASVNTNNQDVSTRKSIHLGITSEIKISHSFSIQPELLYSSQGFNNSLDNLTIKTNYINLPVMVKYYFANGLSLEAGPQIGFLTSAEINGEDVMNNFKSSDYAVSLGAGYKLNSRLNFSLRYSVGVKDVEQGFGIGGGSGIWNRVLQLSVGYNFSTFSNYKK